MGKHYSLRPETQERIINTQQAPITSNVNMSLDAKCYAFKMAEDSVAFYSLRVTDTRAALAYREKAASLRCELRELLDTLVVLQ